MNQQHLVEFIIQAKKRTYAGYGEKGPSSRPKSTDLPYAEGELSYLDSYLGDLDFVGEEVVWYQGRPVWGMNYYGAMLIEDIPADFDSCLKGALSAVPEEAPYRGPNYYKVNHLEYICRWEGDFNHFRGTEQILYNGEKIYALDFHGGRIRSSQ